MENRIYDKSWDFLFKADEAELKEIHNALQNNGIKDLLDLDKDNINPDTVIACLQNSVCKKQDKSINYKSFISTLCNHLELNLKMSDTGVDDIENTLMSYYLQEVLKHCPERYLNDIKAALNLINDDRESMAKEVAAKAKTSSSFKKTLPFLATISTSTWLTIRSLAAFAPTVMSTMLGPMGLAVGALSTAFMGKSFIHSKKDKATRLLPAAFVIIRIRREQTFEIQDVNSAINYVEYLIKSNKTANNISDAANLIINTLNDPIHTQTNELTKFETSKLLPYKQQIITYLLSQYFHFDLIPEINQTTSIYNTIHIKNKHINNNLSIKNDDLYAKISSYESTIHSYEEQLNYYKELLHRIRHNLAPDFAQVLRPYKLYFDDADYSFNEDDIKNALEAGKNVIETLNSIGKENDSKVCAVNLYEEVHKVFSDNDTFTIHWGKNIPQNAYIAFNQSFRTDVLNNIRSNILVHAFGSYADNIVPKSNRIVFIDIIENNDYWVLNILNNGAEFPCSINPSDVFKLGTNYGTHRSSGTGMHYIQSAINNFGGSVEFIPLQNSFYKVQYLIKLKKYTSL